MTATSIEIPRKKFVEKIIEIIDNGDVDFHLMKESGNLTLINLWSDRILWLDPIKKKTNHNNLDAIQVSWLRMLDNHRISINKMIDIEGDFLWTFMSAASHTRMEAKYRPEFIHVKLQE